MLQNRILAESKRLYNLAKNNWIILTLFALSTSYFVYQHAASLSWDFLSFVLNAQYWFQDGYYFEPVRAPLMPLIIGLFSFVGLRAAEYMYIVAVSALYAYSSVRLAKALNFNPVVFYALSLNPYIFFTSLINGSELLALALLELALAEIINGCARSGWIMALSGLARYTMLPLGAFLLLQKNWKRIIKSVIYFLIPISIWFVYNKVMWGSFFTSIADQYAMNVALREYLRQPGNWNDILAVTNILLPFFLWGMFVELRNFITKFISSRNLKAFLGKPFTYRVQLIMFSLIIFTLVTYMSVPLKINRYLIPMFLPAVYFATLAIQGLFKRKAAYAAIIIFAISITSCTIIEFNSGSVLNMPPSYDKPKVYLEAIDTINSLNMSSCDIYSNAWVVTTYLGLEAKPFPREQQVEGLVQEGYAMLNFYKGYEPAYIYNETFMDALPVTVKEQDYMIIGDENCRKRGEGKMDLPYLYLLKDKLQDIHGISINTNPCFVLFMKHPTLEKVCNFVDLKGYTQDTERTWYT